MIGEKRKYSDNIEANENEFYNQNVLKQSIEIAKCSTNALLNGQAPVLASYNEQVKSKGLSQRKEKETDPVKIKARLKQIQFGKNTKGYDNYMLLVPKDRRESKNHIEHPRTPDPYEKYSKRAFDGLIQQWRRNLHKYDDTNAQANDSTSKNIEEENIDNNNDNDNINKKMRTETIVIEEKANDIDENSLVDYEEDADNVEYMRQKSIVKNNSFPTHMDCDDDDDDDVL